MPTGCTGYTATDCEKLDSFMVKYLSSQDFRKSDGYTGKSMEQYWRYTCFKLDGFGRSNRRPSSGQRFANWCRVGRRRHYGRRAPTRAPVHGHCKMVGYDYISLPDSIHIQRGPALRRKCGRFMSHLEFKEAFFHTQRSGIPANTTMVSHKPQL
jgi:hypothetical protein